MHRTAQWPVPRYRQLKRSRGRSRPACPRRPPGPQLAPTAWRETRQRRRHGADAPHGATCSPSAAQRASCKAHATSCPPSRRENPAARQHEGQGEDHADNPPARSFSRQPGMRPSPPIHPLPRGTRNGPSSVPRRAPPKQHVCDQGCSSKLARVLGVTPGMWGQLLTSASVSDCACTYLRSTIGLGIFQYFPQPCRRSRQHGRLEQQKCDGVKHSQHMMNNVVS